ncbi:hypothetical protein ACFQZE_09610 [Paenibacillus sp. GCM10027627]|uniref:hypothetical protein n=1 Tax=unclassified Paenibacillus TaxID=185978 RepID=UPI003645C14A
MHQSRKEQGVERGIKRLLVPDLREARIIAALETGLEAAEEWEGKPQHAGRTGSLR